MWQEKPQEKKKRLSYGNTEVQCEVNQELRKAKWSRQQKTGSQTDVKELTQESKQDTEGGFRHSEIIDPATTDKDKVNWIYEGQNLHRKESYPQTGDGILHGAVELQIKN